MKKVLFLWLPIVGWAVLIFVLSSQPYEDQSLRPFLSQSINVSLIMNLFSKIEFIYAGKVISVHTLGAVAFLEFCIRKAAHFFIFFVLGWLTYRALAFTSKSRQMWSFMISLSLVALYAASDEYHQMFTDNRTSLIHDVFLDIAGGFVGICLAVLRLKLKEISTSRPSISLK